MACPVPFKGSGATEPEVQFSASERELSYLGLSPCCRGAGTTGMVQYQRMSGNQGLKLRRAGATEACIICGIPALPSLVTFAHIHGRDLDLSPSRDPTRVFCLCWQHHHGCYDQGYISTEELLQAEEAQVAKKRRPKPHTGDLAFIQRINDGAVTRHSVWNEKRIEPRPVYLPVDPDEPARGTRFEIWPHETIDTQKSRCHSSTGQFSLLSEQSPRPSVQQIRRTAPSRSGSSYWERAG